MRVTDRIIFERGTTDIAASRERAESAQRVASTGLRVEAPGDDPAAAGTLAAAPVAEARFRAIGAAASAASDELQAADGALSQIGSSLARARELATQFSSSTYDATGRAGAAAEVDSLLRDVVGQLNTRVGGRYLFSGTADAQKPFDPNTLAFSGSTQQRTVEVAPGVFQPASVAADVAIKGTAGGVDVLATLSQLRDALATGTAATVQSTIGALATSVEQVTAARVQAGVSMNALGAAVTASSTAADSVKSRASHLSDADIVSAATELAFSQTALQASMAATAQGFKLSLVDYLR